MANRSVQKTVTVWGGLMKQRMKKLLLVFSVLLLSSLLMGASATKSLVIDVAEDTYVVADLNDPGDAQGFRERNYGSLDFVKAWYIWNVVVEEQVEEQEVEVEGEMVVEEVVVEQEVEKEKVISVIYLKFDLSQLKDKSIESAMLQLYAKNVVLQAPRYVQVFLVSSDWSETTVSFNSGPGWGQTAIATATIYQADLWYGWDVTGDVIRETQPGQISLAVMLRDMDKAAEEVVAFPSREAGGNVSRLVVTYTEPGFVFSWYWWVIGGLVILVLVALAFFGGLKLRRRQPSN